MPSEPMPPADGPATADRWANADPPLMRAIAVEERADRAARIRRNAVALGVPQLEIVEGRAPAALAGLAKAEDRRSALSYDAMLGGAAAKKAVAKRVTARVS